MANMSRINALENRLGDEWTKLDTLGEQMVSAIDEYNSLLRQLKYARLDISLIETQIGDAQDTINELSIMRDDLIAEGTDSQSDATDYDSDDDDGMEDSSTSDSEWGDFEVVPKQRKTRKDILTVGDAIKAHKSSKNHKLKPRSVKRDRTKSPETKSHSKCIKMSHEIGAKF
jgi:hypothetical protein